MRQDEIYEIAWQIFPISDKEKNETFIALLTHFAKLVAAKEREACAKVCEQEQEYWGWDKVFDAAKIIRARGKA
jgi:hypothetical protein